MCPPLTTFEPHVCPAPQRILDTVVYPSPSYNSQQPLTKHSAHNSLGAGQGRSIKHALKQCKGPGPQLLYIQNKQLAYFIRSWCLLKAVTSFQHYTDRNSCCLPPLLSKQFAFPHEVQEWNVAGAKLLHSGLSLCCMERG